MHLVYSNNQFTVVCLVTWPLSGNEAGVDLVLIETFLLFICKIMFLLASFCSTKLTPTSLSLKAKGTKPTAVKWSNLFLGLQNNFIFAFENDTENG